MNDETKFAVLLGRLIDLVRRAPDAVDDHKSALRALIDLAGRQGVTIRLDGSGLAVDDTPLPMDAPFVRLVQTQMAAHQLAEIRLHHRPSAMDVMDLVKTIAFDQAQYPPGHDVQAVLRREQAETVSVLTVEQDTAIHGRRTKRVTDAVREAGVGPDAAGRNAPPRLGILPGKDAAYDEMVRQQQPASSGTLAGAIRGLHRHPGGAGLAIKLEAFQVGVGKALDAHEDLRALEAVVQLIEEEGATPEGDVRRLMSITLRRILASRALHRLARLLIDEVYADQVTTVMRRAGAAGTRVLLDLLVEAPTFAERKAYLGALRQIDEGTDVVSSLLNHHEWFVVRNAADLSGELGIRNAVPALGQAVAHSDARVRRSVGVALARIGTPATVQHLMKVLRDPDREVRIATIRDVKGRGLAALSMLLATAATPDDPELMVECYRALGRIATPDAIQALSQAALKSGGFLSGKKVAAQRVAAIEGLALAGGETVRATLETLRHDRVKDVRTAAEKALRVT